MLLRSCSPSFFRRPRAGARRPAAPRGGFTLVELLTVVVIIIILMTITLTVGAGVVAQQNRARALGDMSAIAAALETFKLRYGDYPAEYTGAIDDWSDTLVCALTGREVPEIISGKYTALYQVNSSDVAGYSVVGPAFAELNNFNYSTDGLLDPWGNAYLYRYKKVKGGAFETGYEGGFILVSRGPDGQPSTPSDNFPGATETNGVLPNNYFTSNPQLADNLVYGLSN